MEARIIFVAIVFAIVISLFLAYIFSKPKIDINSELAKLNLDSTTIQALNHADYKSLEKYDSFWVVKDCKDDVYFKLFLAEDGYLLSYCTSWSTPREAYLKLREYLRIKECVDENAEDRLLRESETTKTYEVCGLKVTFKDECIVGVRA